MLASLYCLIIFATHVSQEEKRKKTTVNSIVGLDNAN